MNLIQISDCHLLADREAEYRGVKPFASLQAVVRRVAGEAPDLVLATGDLSQDGSAGSYQSLATALAPLDCPVLALPGNHDDLDNLSAVTGLRVMDVLDLGPWRILPVDSSVPGMVAGRVTEVELARVERTAVGAGHILLAVHHHPLPMGSAWLDALGLANGAELLALAARLPNARGLVFGHAHQAYAGEFQGLPLWGTPSTAVQFAPGSPEFAVDTRPPAYRRLRLAADGSIGSEVVWL